MTKHKNSGLNLVNEDLSNGLVEHHYIEKSEGNDSLLRLADALKNINEEVNLVKKVLNLPSSLKR